MEQQNPIIERLLEAATLQGLTKTCECLLEAAQTIRQLADLCHVRGMRAEGLPLALENTIEAVKGVIASVRPSDDDEQWDLMPPHMAEQIKIMEEEVYAQMDKWLDEVKGKVG